MIEKTLNTASCHEDADRIAREQDDRLTPLERLAAFMKLMEPYYAAAPDFKEFIALMIDASVRFVMIGGFAYNLYRNPRATGDIDFVVSIDPANQKKLRKVLVEFGFGSTLPADKELLIGQERILMLGRAPFRIDLLGEIDGVTFLEVEASCRHILIDEMSVPVISPELLLKNKQASGRPKDLADAKELSQWLFPENDGNP